MYYNKEFAHQVGKKDYNFNASLDGVIISTVT